MKNKIRWLTRTAAMLALLIALQWGTKPLGQIVTGSCVNAVLAITALAVGMGSGITIALLSPVFAFLLGIAPNLVTVPAIMVGNTVFVVLLKALYGKCVWRKIAAWLTAAAVKFAVLYLLVSGLICGLLSETLLGAGLLKVPMLSALPATFSWPQLITALIGGGMALLIAPVLSKALHRS
ncbi:MAG: ECF transporter S component [Faecousia sp.]